MRRTSWIAPFLWFLGIGGMLFLGGVSAAEAPDPRLAKVLADWQKRQNWFQAVEYQVRGEFKVPRGSYDVIPTMITGAPAGQVTPPQDVQGPVSFTILLDFVKGRHRRESREQRFDVRTSKLTPLTMKDAFNGSVMKCFIPKEKNPKQQVGVTQPEMTVVSGNMKNGAFRNNYYPIFFAQGRIYTVMEPILPGQLRNKPDPNYLYVHGTGVQDGRACLILRTQTLKMSTTSFDEYWVDAERDSAILRYLSYSGKSPMGEARIVYRMSQDHWLPDSWRWTVNAPGSQGKPLYYEDMRVEKITANPPVADADFELGEIKPGMLVEERTDLPTSNPISTPKSKISIFRPKDDGGRDAIPDPAHRQGDQYQAPPKGQWWIWFCLVTLLAGVAGFFLRLRHRKVVRE